jgi:poly-gamma-glutamate capsule biosynthesis protein CapA/YwtB (metallophosphatase superfamily)
VRKSVLDAIAQAKRETDVVIVAAHWGHEYVFYPEAAQVSGAKQLAAAGVDVLLGDHPHTLQPVDVIDTQGRKTLVIYSLGNFIASQGAFQAKSFTSTGAIFYVGLQRGADGRVRVSGYRYLPTISVDRDTRPAPIAAGTLQSVVAHVRQMMRDPDGARQVPANPAAIGNHVNVCAQSAAPAPQPAIRRATSSRS